MVETALVLPLFLMVIFGIIILGIGVFYQQQVTNAAREAARYAAIHSATAQCPTVSRLDPDPTVSRYFRCDPPPWTDMVAQGRSLVVGLRSSDVFFSACWSGYWTKNGAGAWSDYDAPPFGPSASPVPTYLRPCTIGGIDPETDANALTCPPPSTTVADDMASNLASYADNTANRVTVYGCHTWRPPLAGFLLIPSSVVLRAVVTEPMEYQR